MTRLSADERLAIELELVELQARMDRLRAMLAAQPQGSGGDTIRLLQPLCSCGLPIDHRYPGTGIPRACRDETERIALAESRRPPVPTPAVRP